MGDKGLGAFHFLGGAQTMGRERKKGSEAHKGLLMSDHCPINGKFISWGHFKHTSVLSSCRLRKQGSAFLIAVPLWPWLFLGIDKMVPSLSNSVL